MAYTEQDRDYLAAIIYGEARGEIPQGQAAVAHTVLNRAAATGQSIPQVALDYRQYTAMDPADHNRRAIESGAARNDPHWQSAQEVATQVLTGDIPDPTRGATHYYAPDAMRAQTGRPDPRWGRGHSGWRETSAIGGHVFGFAAGGVPDNPDSRNRPALSAAEAGAGTPLEGIGEVFGPPVVPSNPPRSPSVPPGAPVAALSGHPVKPVETAELPEVGAPVSERSLGNYLAGLVVQGAAPRVGAGVDDLKPSTQERVAAANALTSSDLGVTSTVRAGHPTHGRGGAVDLRNRDMTALEEAQSVAALARAGFEAIGPYGPGDLGPRSPAHIHAGDDRRYNLPDSIFQQARRDDNPFLSGTQPKSGLYDALDHAVSQGRDPADAVSDSWFGPTAPTPSPTAEVRNQGDGSLDLHSSLSSRSGSRYSPPSASVRQPSRSPSDFQYQQSPQPRVSQINDFWSGGGSGGFGQSGQKSPTDFQHARTGSASSGPTRSARSRVQSSPARADLSGVFDAIQINTSAPRFETRYRTEVVANPNFTPIPGGMAAQYQMRALGGPASRPLGPHASPVPQTITRRVPYQVTIPQPVIPISIPAPVSVAPTPTVHTPSRDYTEDAQGRTGWGAGRSNSYQRAQSGVGGGRAYGGTDQSYTSNARSSSGGGGGGGGGGGRVICTHFFRKGMLSRGIWRADLEYTHRNLSERTVRGYHFWAIPYVRLMRKSPLAERLMYPIAKHRARELAYQLGRAKKGSWRGKLVRLTLEPLCWVIGGFVGARDWKSLWETDGCGT